MATLKDVAKLAGVSPSTVSRTLSSRVFVEDETRERVMKAVEELHYEPSITARALKEGKTYTLALMVPDINSLYYPELMRSMEKCAAEHGYTILLFNNMEQLEKEKKAISLVTGRGVDGLLCMSVSDEIEHLEALQREKGIPVVLFNRFASDVISNVTMDNETGAYLMTKHLLDNGHRKIAGMFGTFDYMRFRKRYNGCKKALQEAGIEDFKRYMSYDIASVDEAYQRTRQLLSQEDRPTAFFATMDILAIGIYSGIGDSGLRIPDDVSVVGFDDIFMTKYMVPPLTTYHTSIDELARKAVEVLLEKIENPSAPVQSVTMDGYLNERRSVRKLESI